MKVSPSSDVSKILIVDDHAEMREMTKYFLGENAFEFAECIDGAEAVSVYETFLPDWVLMDWQMKKANGIDATRQIIEKFPQAQILILTQFDDEQLKDAAEKAGAHGLILKENLVELRKHLS